MTVALVLSPSAWGQPGAVDPAFDPGPGANASVLALAVQADGKVLVAGDFTELGAAGGGRIGRLQAGGALDATFNPGTGANNGIRAMALAPEGRIFVGGAFTTLNGAGYNRVARLNADGSVDTTFTVGLGANDTVNALLVAPDGRVVVGGLFTTVNGMARNRIGRLNPDGSVDTSFNPGTGANNAVMALALQTDGRIVVGGFFTAINGVIRQRIARLNGDGSVDATFNPGTGAINPVRAIAIQTDGKLVIGGDFTLFAGVSKNFIARLNANGTLDASFGAGTDAPVTALAIDGGGRILIGGRFTAVNGVGRARIARLNADGSLDTAFNPGSGANDAVEQIALQSDGQVVIAGAFTLVNGLSRPRVARLLGSGGTTMPGTIQFAVTDVRAGENSGAVLLGVMRTGPTNSAVSVGFATRDGTAAAGADYTARNGVLALAAGQSSQTLSVPILEDALVEGEETFSVELANPGGGAVLGSNAVAIVTIVDNDTAPGSVLEFAAAAFSVNESGGVATVTVRRSGNTSSAVSVNYAARDGTATADLDYRGVSGALTFAAGQTSQSFTVPILDDTLSEGNETVSLILSGPSAGATLGNQATAILTIVDNDAGPAILIEFVAASYSISEGGTNSVIAVRRTGESGTSVSVNYTTADGTAAAGSDYRTASGVLTFGPGETNRTFSVSIIDDTLGEGNETVQLGLSLPTGGASLGSQRTSVLTIVDNDSAGLAVIEFSNAPVRVNESAGIAALTVRRSGNLDGAVSVGYATTNGTARAETDYTALSGTLTFAAGQTERTLTVPILDDTLAEGDESFTVVLVNPGAGAVLGGQSSAAVTIADNEPAPPATIIEFTSAAYTTGESSGSLTISVRRSGETNGPAAVDYATANGTAVAGADYQSAAGTLQFGAGQTLQSFAVTILDDDVVEENETVNLILGNPSGAILGQTNTALLTITDDDFTAVDVIEFAAASYAAVENETNAVITLRRNTNLRTEVSVRVATVPGTATPGADYVAASGTVTFAAGESSRVFLVPLLDDNLVEPNETVGLTLSSPSGGATLGAQVTAELIIADNDAPPFDILDFTALEFTVAENAAAATVTVRRTTTATNTVSVTYEAAAGSALPGIDFTVVSGVLTFPADQPLQSFSVPILDDAEAEPDETVILSLRSPTGGAALGTQDRATLKIVDDDRIASGGTLDSGFGTGAGPNGFVYAVATQTDGKIVLGGIFTAVNSVGRNRIARLNPDGSLDPSFNPGTGANGAVNAISLQSDGKMIIAGAFTTVNGATRARVARLEGSGALDSSFQPAPGADFVIESVVVQASGRIVIGGEFNSVNGVARRNIARLNPDGSLDETFTASANEVVYALARQPDDRIVLGGYFSLVNDQRRVSIARLNADGSLDESFNPIGGADAQVYDVTLHTDGKILIGGEFTTVNNQRRNFVARLESNGSLDAGFSSRPDSWVNRVRVQTDGRILIGGGFTSVAGVTRNRFARLEPDGSLEAGFAEGTGANGTVNALAIQADGRIVVGGEFTTFHGLERNYLVRVHGSAQSTVPQTRPVFQSIQPLLGGRFRLLLTTEAGKNYVIQGSTNLVTWTALATNTAAGTTLTVDDLAAPAFARRYYRALRLP